MKNTFKTKLNLLVDPKEKTAEPAVNFVQLGEGPPVILVHGLAASLHDWDMLLPALAEAGYTGYALDLLGHGDSYKPQQLEAYTSDAVYDHMQAWIDSLTLEQPAIVIGHSLGGYMSLQFTLQHPNRVRALVLANPFYTQEQLPPALRFFLRRPLLNTTLIERTPYWLFRLLIDVTSLQFGNSNDNLHSLPEAVRIQTALDFKRAAPGIYNIPRTLRDLTPDLPRIHQPTLVIWGARDQTIDPKTFPTLVEKLPNARGESMPICGHVAHQCHALDFNKKVFSFLDSLKS
jgi:pimeloyl-ACP methyl ester carboxylesterase